MLDISEGEPIGSGCVAQVYKGTLKTRALPSFLNEEPKETKRASENSSVLTVSFIARLPLYHFMLGFTLPCNL